MQVTIYTDGASSGNPGPGGLGVVMKAGGHQKEISEGFRKTTNNRMELLAVIRGLEALKKPNLDVLVVSDSKYVVDAVSKGWLWNWLKTGFKGKKNEDLWQRYAQLHRVFKPKFKWIKGHAGHPENERCDELAVIAAKRPGLPADIGYERSIS